MIRAVTAHGVPRSSFASRLLQGYLRAPDHPGKLRLARSLGRLFSGGARTRLPEGIVLFLSPADWIEYLLLRGDAYEPATRAFLRQNLRPGDGAIYAGVNFGLHVIDAALAVGPSGRVVGVEPQPRARARAARNIAANGAGAQTTLVPRALGAAAGRATMAWAPADNAGAASLLAAGPGFEIELIPLAEVESELRGAPFRALLLDVEGYELEVIKGLGSRPDIVVCEVAPALLARQGILPEAVGASLAALGYELFDVRGRRVEATDLAELPEHNLCAVLPGRTVRWP